MDTKFEDDELTAVFVFRPLVDKLLDSVNCGFKVLVVTIEKILFEVDCVTEVLGPTEVNVLLDDVDPVCVFVKVKPVV